MTSDDVMDEAMDSYLSEMSVRDLLTVLDVRLGMLESFEQYQDCESSSRPMLKSSLIQLCKGIRRELEEKT